MTVTNDERRKVAARLRDFEQLRELFAESNICAFEVALGVDYMDWEHICDRLAELIEPGPQCPYYSDERHWCGIHDIETERTCRIDMPVIDWETGETDCRCSSCGFSADPQYWAETYVYCPNCGAKVTEVGQ